MKQLVFSLLRFSGLVRLYRYLRRNEITILMLHGVAGRHADAGWQPLWPRVTPEQLDRTLGHLAAQFEFISFAEAVDMLAGKKPVRPYCLVLTFDDGYRNNLTEALPVLRKHNAPATLFLATGYIETTRPYWIDRLDYALQKAPDEVREVAAGAFSFDLRGLNRQQLEKQYKHMRLAVKNNTTTDSEMLAVFDELSSQLEGGAGEKLTDILDRDPYAGVGSWAEFKAAANDGVCIGSHTVDHYRLDSVDQDDVDRQLRTSKAEIEQRLQQDCPYFCYPNGSYNAMVAERTAAAGYEAAVTVDHGLNAVGDDLMTLKRFSLPTKKTAFENVLAISGFMDAAPIRMLRGSRG